MNTVNVAIHIANFISFDRTFKQNSSYFKHDSVHVCIMDTCKNVDAKFSEALEQIGFDMNNLEQPVIKYHRNPSDKSISYYRLSIVPGSAYGERCDQPFLRRAAQHIDIKVERYSPTLEFIAFMAVINPKNACKDSPTVEHFRCNGLTKYAALAARCHPVPIWNDDH
jgi:hypothetical protein